MSKVLICIAGIDGSGKTTVAKQLIKLHYSFKYIWARWEPFILYPLIWFVNRNKGKESNIEKHYKSKKNKKQKLLRSNIVKGIWLFLGEIDYLLQLIFKFYMPYLFNKKIICDRYIYDFYIDQAINLSVTSDVFTAFLKKRIFFYVFPKPTHVIYINVSSDVGFNRKQDGTSLEYLDERKLFYDKLSNIYNVTIIDGEKKIEDVVQEVSVILSKYE